MKKNKKPGKIKNKEPHVRQRFLSDKWRNIIVLGLIITYAFIVFFKAIHFEFVLWDDDHYIMNNLLIRDLSFDGLKNIFTTPVLGMYNPLTFLIYAVEYKLWGLDTAGFHTVNILFHLVATITVYKFIFRLTKRYETATIVALLFAIHPMHVGVVTWVSEIKTSLFLIFYFLALMNYLKYIQNNYKPKYLVYIAMLFILSALSKPSAVTLAPMLFLLDYYLSRKIDKRLFLEKIPFFVIAIFFGILTLYTHNDADDTIFDINLNYSFINNLLISNYSIVFYINKLFVPLDLCTIYPYPDNTVFLPLKYYFSIPIIPIILLLIYKSRKFKKELIFGVLFFVIAISVVLRIVPSGFFRAANRYTYLSYTGLFFIIGQYLTYILDNKFSYAKKIKTYFIALLCIYIVFCSYRATVRVKVWENSITLFDDIIKKKPKVAVAYHNRGLAKQQLGDLTGAQSDFEKAIECDPKYVSAYNNLGEIKRALNDEESALANYQKALSFDPKYANAYNNIGIIMFNQGKYEEASINYNMAIELDAYNGPAYHNRASLKILQGDTLGALEDWKTSAALGVKESSKPIEIFSSSSSGN
jgi:protein O-mannosyl-transferase